jgi:hypothetical protein
MNNAKKQMTPDDMLDLTSGQFMQMIDQCKHELREILRELTTAINNCHTLKTMLPLKLAAIKLQFLDLDYGRNESMDRALGTQEYMDAMNQYNSAHDLKTELELIYEVLLNNMKAINGVIYLKNTELKIGA